MALQPISQGPFVRGVVASNQPLAQPKGSIARGSNLIYTVRGALTPCDGSQLIHAFNGAIGSGRGKAMADFLFAPTGVARYYLRVAKALDVPLGPPQNLAAVLASGGSLSSGTTYYYKVTALDNAGGETTASNEASATPSGGNLSVALTWNIVPNGVKYNVYRGTAPGAESLLIGTGLPVGQVVAGTLQVTYTDTGAASSASITATASSWSTQHPNVYVATIILTVPSTTGLATGQSVALSGFGNALINGTRTVNSIIDATHFSVVIFGVNFGTGSGGGGTIAFGAVPSSDTTQQTALFQMPTLVGQPANIPVSYNNSNIVALFPADPLINVPIEGGGGGGSGGGGGTGGGGSGGGTGGGSSPTPAGGVPGNVTPIPMFRQFTNRAIIALGNGFVPQIFSDATGTLVNPATIAAISAISVDAFGVVTVTTSVPHGIPSAAVGGNVLIAGVTNGFYNGAFPTISIVDTTHYKVRNLAAIAQGASSGGTSTTTSLPLISTFVPALPKWTATTQVIVGDVFVPATQPSPAIYVTCVQSGTTGSVEPSWPAGAPIGNQVNDGSAIWQVSAQLNAAAPPPPGAAHIEVFSGALWVFNTSPSNTSNGLDGPTSIRMSAIGNPNSWNPVNQAFLDKDDGQEGMGLAKFTITALGIPPEGSLIAFKNQVPYQLIGVFGATNFQIQPVSSNMGCIAPRTIDFVPGFGIMRMTHLGIGLFSGVKDEIISEQIRPYLFNTNDSSLSDITVADAASIALSWSAQTANPPMNVYACPIGVSGGQLTRLFCYDLVLKAWGIVDLPFPISTIAQFKTNVANPVTIIGGFSDGCLSRWQAADVQWDVGGSGARSPSNVSWSFRSLRAASQDVDQRIYARRVVITGNNSGAPGTITVSVYKSGVLQQALSFYVPSGYFDIDMPVGFVGRDFDAIVSSSIHGDTHGITWETEPRPIGVLAGVGI